MEEYFLLSALQTNIIIISWSLICRISPSNLGIGVWEAHLRSPLLAVYRTLTYDSNTTDNAGFNFFSFYDLFFNLNYLFVQTA